MAIGSITLTFTGSGISYSPSDWNYGEIYSDTTITCIDNTGDVSGATFWLYNASGSSTIASGTVPSGQTLTLAQIFPGQTLVGNKLGDGRSLQLASIVARTTTVGAPSGLALSGTLSRDAVELSWKAGSAGTNNSVSGYDVEYQDSADGSTWPGSWQAASGSPTTALKLSVSPPATVGYYRRFRVRTRGSAGLHSAYVTSGMLRRKWDAFGAWTDATLTARKTHIRAVHIAEIRQRINVIRAFYGLPAYSYTPITARSTKIAKWAALIRELRAAVDGIGTAQSWNTLEEGKPRIAHITQLRGIIDAM